MLLIMPISLWPAYPFYDGCFWQNNLLYSNNLKNLSLETVNEFAVLRWSWLSPDLNPMSTCGMELLHAVMLISTKVYEECLQQHLYGVINNNNWNKDSLESNLVLVRCNYLNYLSPLAKRLSVCKFLFLLRCL